MKKSILLMAMLIALVSLCLVFASCDSGSGDDPTPVSVTDVTLNQTELILLSGTPDVKLFATVLPDNATDKRVSWSSDKPEYATVDNEGNVHAVAPGAATITVTTTDGGKRATCTVTVTPPACALSGLFSVSEGKKVYFSKGNLWYDGDSFEFETNQYDVQSSWDASHVSHFYWSKTASVAYAETYSESGTSDSDVFFTNAEEETAKLDFTVNSVTGKYRTLSKAEWGYLLKNTRMVNGKPCYSNAVSGVTIESNIYNGIFLYPDDYNGEVVGSGSMTWTWEKINESGIVFLPAAGYRNVSSFVSAGSYGVYWSATAHDSNYAGYLGFRSSGASTFNGDRFNGRSVRLVCGAN